MVRARMWLLLAAFDRLQLQYFHDHFANVLHWRKRFISLQVNTSLKQSKLPNHGIHRAIGSNMDGYGTG